MTYGSGRLFHNIVLDVTPFHASANITFGEGPHAPIELDPRNVANNSGPVVIVRGLNT